MEGLDLPLLVWRLRSSREAFLRSCSEEPRVSCIWTRAASRRPPRRTSRSVCRGKQQHQREQTVRTAVRRRDNTEPPSMCRRVPPSRDEDLSQADMMKTSCCAGALTERNSPAGCLWARAPVQVQVDVPGVGVKDHGWWPW